MAPASACESRQRFNLSAVHGPLPPRAAAGTRRAKVVKARTHFMVDLPYLELWRTNDRQSQTVSRVQGSRAAFLAAAAIVVRSGAPRGTSQLPPTHGTASSASHSAAFSCVMPPVGQKRQRGKGEESALRAGMPPAAMAGKNLNRLRPMSNPRMMSPAVAMPGRKGIPEARAFLLMDSVRPGETMNRAPA